MKAKAMWAGALVVILLGSYFAVALQHNASLGKSFNAIEQGATREQTLELMGRPSLERNSCRDAPTWLGQPVQSAQCVAEYQYDARLVPEFWTIGFDANGKAVAKYDYVSP
jgi:hypothetical protein